MVRSGQMMGTFGRSDRTWQCEQKKGVSGSPRLLAEVTGRVEVPFTKMGKHTESVGLGMGVRHWRCLLDF